MANFHVILERSASWELVSAWCTDFFSPCRGQRPESQHFREWFPASWELWPITYTHCSFILDILISKSNFFSLKNSLNIFTKFPEVGEFCVLWIKNVEASLICQLSLTGSDFWSIMRWRNNFSELGPWSNKESGPWCLGMKTISYDRISGLELPKKIKK